MFCSKCGAENSKGAKFCKACGQPLGEVSSSVDTKKNEQKDSSPVNSPKSSIPKLDLSQAVDRIKKLPKNVLIGGGAALIALIVIIGITVSASNTIDLNKYLTTDAKGYDGYGKATATIDWDAIEEKYGDKIQFTSQAQSEMGGFLSYMNGIDVLQEYVDVDLETSKKVSNGDEVAYIWDVDDELSTYLKCKVKYSDGTFAVSGLEEVGTFDAFADVEVAFSGISPNGSLDFNYNGYEISSYDFDCDKTNSLKNGDTITISIDDSNIEYYAENLGMVPEPLEKTYTVEGLDEYVTSYSEFTEDFINVLKGEAEDTIYAYAAKSYSSGNTINDLEYAGYILNQEKEEQMYGGSFNNIYIIYSGVLSSSNDNINGKIVYYPVRFSTIIQSEGELSYEDNNGIAGSAKFDGTWASTKGYLNALECYVDIVDENSEIYQAECGDGFETYAAYQLVTKIDDLSDTFIEKIYADAQERVEDYIDSNYNSGSVASDLEVLGEYLLVAKEQSTDLENNNELVVVCSATVSNSKGRFDTTTVYFPVEYDGLVSLPDDKYVATSIAGIVGSSSFPDSWYSTDGYIDSADMFSGIITSNRDSYTYEVSENLKQFGE
jgi:hypothetical protein